MAFPSCVRQSTTSSLGEVPGSVHHLTKVGKSRSDWMRSLGARFDTPAAWVTFYFAFSLALATSNHDEFERFPFPYSLTAIHAFCGSVGCWTLFRMRYFIPTRVNTAEYALLISFSILYTLNIAASDIALSVATVRFFQLARVSTPLFTIAFSVSSTAAHSLLDRARLLFLVLIIAGVGLGTYNNYYFIAWGLAPLTMFGTFVASCTARVNKFLESPPSEDLTPPSPSTTPTKLRLRLTGPPPMPHLAARVVDGPVFQLLDVIHFIAPLVFVQCIAFAWASGELEHMRGIEGLQMFSFRGARLGLNGAIAFGLNVVSCTATKRTGPLTMVVAASAKQVLVIVLAALHFNLPITFANAVGILLTLGSSAAYCLLEPGKTSRSRA